ncbi:ABC transporter ATP-binding protein [Blastococcus sp. Marseille-P5729]|uniref:ABC transporter ATP-binding protein n=1 Tax=Blastococcus sp. Marseille-P5729 TaxID=2086582 RepID=UPI0018FEA371|nr:ABC transporter ATP-binding protein [Blastococcus sp. Marseille-P5729]
MIEFIGVTKRFEDGQPAVDDLSLRIPTGQITVLVGPSGCGKTTTLRMVNRMVEPTSGTVRIDGEDVAGMAPAQLRRGIGYVIQHAGLFPHRTIVDNIATVPRLTGTAKADAREHALELMDRVGLDTALAGRYPAQLSGGQQQRVGVARALAADPPILLMDEPFSAVDPVVRDALQRELLELQADFGKTIVFVTHDIDEAIRLGDQIAVLAVGGRLAQFATPGDLLAHPADDFVRGFIGRDRGIRALSFVTPGAAPGPPTGGWEVLTGDDGQPVAWRGPDGVRYGIDDVLGPRDSARRALDLALLSPNGYVVCVDESGAYAGTVARHDLLTEQTR